MAGVSGARVFGGRRRAAGSPWYAAHGREELCARGPATCYPVGQSRIVRSMVRGGGCGRCWVSCPAGA